MARTKVAISLDEHTLQRLDQLVAEAVFPSRSQAIQIAIEEKLVRLDQTDVRRLYISRSALLSKMVFDIRVQFVVDCIDVVAVGTPVTRRPPHRSRRAVFPHRAPQ